MFKPGQSGNRAGRPRGIVDKRAKNRKLLDPATPEVIAKLNEMAKGGDIEAIKLFLSLVLPKLKDETPRRRISLDPGQALEAQGRSVVAAIARGDLAPDEGAALLNGLARQGELEKLGLLADVVAALAARSGIEIPPELKLRQRIPATIKGEAI